MMLSKTLSGEFTKMMPGSIFAKMRPTTVSHASLSHGHVVIAALGAWARVEKTGVEDLVEDASVIGLLKK
jgi:hypothetical protein